MKTLPKYLIKKIVKFDIFLNNIKVIKIIKMSFNKKYTYKNKIKNLQKTIKPISKHLKTIKNKYKTHIIKLNLKHK